MNDWFDNLLDVVPIEIVLPLAILFCVAIMVTTIVLCLKSISRIQNRQLYRQHALEQNENSKVGQFDITNDEAKSGVSAQFEYVSQKPCTTCSGKGRIGVDLCKDCNGTGALLTRLYLNVTVPPLTEDGHILPYVLQDPKMSELLPEGYVIKARNINPTYQAVDAVFQDLDITNFLIQAFKFENSTDNKKKINMEDRRKIDELEKEIIKQWVCTYACIVLTPEEMQNGASKVSPITPRGRCQACGGQKYLQKRQCKVCKGSGAGLFDKVINVQIPPGVEDGYTLRIPNKGGVIHTGRVRDLVITVKALK